jgi:hypothetical protein
MGEPKNSYIDIFSDDRRLTAVARAEIAVLLRAQGGLGEGNRTLVFSLEVGKFPQCFQEPFRHFSASWAIEMTTEFLFVGMAIAGPCAFFSSHLTAATRLADGLPLISRVRKNVPREVARTRRACGI